METFVTIMAVIFVIYLIFKWMVAVNRKRAGQAFERGYHAASPEELWSIIEQQSRPALVTMNVSSALLGRILSMEAPNLESASIAIAFAEQWNNDAVMIRAQQLEVMVKKVGKETALAALRDTIGDLY